jgi:integrase
VKSVQLLEQRLGLLQIERLEAFGEPAIDRSEQSAGASSRLPWSRHSRAIAQYEAYHAIGTKARLAFALGYFTMQRRGDVIRMGRQHIRSGGELHVTQDVPCDQDRQAVQRDGFR